MNHLVVTGGNGTLGQAIVRAFDLPGWVTASPGREELDVTEPEAIRRFFHSRPVELLVCAAGITRDALLAKTPEKAWDEVWSVNYGGAAACAAAVLPHMIGQGRGHIVFISSHSAIHPPAGQCAYASAKAALLGLTASLAAKHGPAGIRVNAILPGFMETAMTREVSDSRKAEVLADHSLGRFNTPVAVGAFIHHLQHHLPHTSGQIFQLDSRPPA